MKQRELTAYTQKFAGAKCAGAKRVIICFYYNICKKNGSLSFYMCATYMSMAEVKLIKLIRKNRCVVTQEGYNSICPHH